MAERLAHRDLRNHSGEVLRAVAAGETFEITNHGQVVAVISAPPNPSGQLRIIPASNPGDWASLPLHPSDIATEELLDDLRADML